MDSESWTGDPDGLLEAAVVRVMGPMADAFRELWSGGNGPRLLDSFLAGDAKFLVSRDGIFVMVPGDLVGGGRENEV